MHVRTENELVRRRKPAPYTCFVWTGWFYAHPKPRKIRWFCIRTRSQSKFSKHRMQKEQYIFQPLIRKAHRLWPSQINRLWKDHPHDTQTPVGTGEALSSGCQNTMRRNWRTLWKSVCIGLFFKLLYCKKGQSGKACQGLEAAERFLCQVVLLNPSCMWRKDPMIQGWYTEGDNTVALVHIGSLISCVRA